jgi:hypothetical protein
MPSAYVGSYPTPYAHGYHYPPSGLAGLIVLTGPLLIVAVLLTLRMIWDWAGRRIQALRMRSRSAAVVAPAAAIIPGPPVLASEIERDRIADRLCEAIGEGRLSFEEGGERIDAVLQSRYRHDLERLVKDLPALAAATPVPRPARRRALLAAGATVVLAALVVQLAVGLWVLWPVAVASVAMLTHLSRR